MRIRILRIMHRINIGGPTHHAGYLTKYLNNDEFETLLISGIINKDEESGEHILNEIGVKVEYVKNMGRSINLLKDIKSYFEIKGIIKKFRPHIVHTHAAKSGTLGRLAAISENIPLIIHTFHGHVFHSYFGKFKTKIYLLIERYLAKKSDKIIAISKEQKEELVNKFSICPNEKIEIIQLGFDLSKFSKNSEFKRKSFRNEFNIDNNDIAIGIVGRLTAIKNQKYFINVINEVRKKTSKNIRAFIIGDGEDRELLELYSNQCNIDFNSKKDKFQDKLLCFTSWRKDMDFVYSGLDIVCLTSLNEGTPVTLIEAQAAQKVVVSTDVGGVQDVVLNNKSGFLANKKNHKEFAALLLNLIENNDLRDEMSKNGKKFVIEKFNYSRLVSDIKNLYLKLLKIKENA
jgi:glycosyltransferase involved in cell wall biosynthesis